MAPRVRQSGDTAYHGRITKEGSPRVRWALVQAAQVAVRWDMHFAEKYHRIRSRRGAGKAIGGGGEGDRGGDVSYAYS